MTPSADATGARLHRLNWLGLLGIRAKAGQSITQLEAHTATLDAMYNDGGGLRGLDDEVPPDMGTAS